MSYSVKPGSILGRIGSEIGKGLSEQIPKEVERNRLAQGLEELSKQQGLTPFQQLGKLATLPGVTPQLIQSGSELLKQQAQGQAYRRAGRSKEGEPTPPQNTTQQFRNQSGNINITGKGKPKLKPGEQPYGTQQEINPVNPTDQRFLEKHPWTPEKRNQAISDYIDFGFEPSAAAEMARRDEAADLAAPGIEKANQSYLEGIEDKIRKEFRSQLEEATQKEGKELYKDIQGELLLDLEKGVRQDLATNPDANMKEVVERWRKKGVEFAKARPLLDQLAKRDTWDFLFKHGETKKKLGSFQKIYADVGRQEEFYNKLKTANTKDTIGFDMSPQGAAQIAFPRSEGVKKAIQGYKPKGEFFNHKSELKLASEVAKSLTPDDSLLAIMRDVRDRYPGFDQSTFLDYFRQNPEKLFPRQQRELGEGEGAMNPAWGDEWIHFGGLK